MQANSNIHLFAGPSLYQANGVRIELPETIHLHAPVARGDISVLLKMFEAAHPSASPGMIVLVDGVFQQRLAVGHLELRTALEQNWEIYGLCSMGAIRAYEMRNLGMKGFGRIYRLFEADEDFQDDEVALLHGADPPYRPLSEPLVHCRFALEKWIDMDLISPQCAFIILEKLKSLWFGERTLRLFRTLVMERVSPRQASQLEHELQRFDDYRLKTVDLKDFIYTILSSV